MVRDGLARLPDVFTAGDMSDIVRYLCMCLLFFLSVLLLWSPYVIGRRYIFSCCGLFFFLLSFFFFFLYFYFLFYFSCVLCVRLI